MDMNLSDNSRLNGSYKDDEREGNAGPSKPYRSNTIQSPMSPENKSVKLPTRSLTSPLADRDKGMDSLRMKPPKAPTNNADTPRTAVPKVKFCLKCDKRVDDGRWVSVDSGGVLCERCWKNLYLPKCRRCNLPIERQAVFSSDGQLKGKYHRDCFNCHICHKPFPDKTFYVFNGKPLCAYHYHEANDSLCSAAHCGQPIEGPCAISHTGDRYHPEHMTCKYEGRGGAGHRACDVHLKEYWEMGGRMLCETHARGMAKRTRGSHDERRWGSRSGSEAGSATDAEERWAQDLRAMRRVTRFIDLGNEDGLR
ncbi:hypothetical protein CVT24_012959 [Panaeolus cyanescens]|uniref:LIM zinc-binding domain-containing protein n=1 Tax=Panaeolus cyanescens TaxID=181874 RepID=A0A409WKZ8_9AGAR|nr:hypothetical protein CVT24_012959 [Panaeolus cyanescens]